MRPNFLGPMGGLKIEGPLYMRTVCSTEYILSDEFAICHCQLKTTEKFIVNVLVIEVTDRL